LKKHNCIIESIKALGLLVLVGVSQLAIAQHIEVDVELKTFGFLAEKPYLALWAEHQNGKQQALIVQREKVKWLRDLKVFWRKIARENRQMVDGVTGATSAKSLQHFSFDLADSAVSIALEVVREDGKRELIKLDIGQPMRCQSGKKEIERVCISTMQ